MRFLNLLANKFFALLFSWLLGQQVRDTLCGTKALYREDYERIAANRAYFGDFDPFGDFDLLFGASRLNLRIVDLAVRYHERQYGETNISRFRHGLLLLRMSAFAARKLKLTLGHMSTPDTEREARLQREIEHHRRIAHRAEEVWNWDSPAGRRRADRRAELFVEHGDLRPGRRALELGCGTGVFLEQTWPPREPTIHGLDLSEDLLAKARTRLAAASERPPRPRERRSHALPGRPLRRGLRQLGPPPPRPRSGRSATRSACSKPGGRVSSPSPTS